jgi:hypothetical protein
VLYAKGNIDILKVLDAIAIIGTRSPTALGVDVASRSVSEYSEFAGFDHKALWFGPKQATTCELKDNFSDTLLGLHAVLHNPASS